eukprot:1154375-Pelagomonas_calceolata.AAC.1
MVVLNAWVFLDIIEVTPVAECSALDGVLHSTHQSWFSCKYPHAGCNPEAHRVRAIVRAMLHVALKLMLEQ